MLIKVFALLALAVTAHAACSGITCDTCKSTAGCGWCGVDNSGICFEGNDAGPIAPMTCPATWTFGVSVCGNILPPPMTGGGGVIVDGGSSGYWGSSSGSASASDLCFPPCEFGFVCNADTRLCMLAPPANCAGCSAGFLCMNGVCVPGASATCATACPEGTSCTFGVCAPISVPSCNPPCTGDAVCLPTFSASSSSNGQTSSASASVSVSCASPTAACEPACAAGATCIFGKCQACPVCGGLSGDLATSLSVALPDFGSVTVKTTFDASGASATTVISPGSLTTISSTGTFSLQTLQIGDAASANNSAVIFKTGAVATIASLAGKGTGAVILENGATISASIVSCESGKTTTISFTKGTQTSSFSASSKLQIDGTLVVAGQGTFNFPSEVAGSGIIKLAGGTAINGNPAGATLCIGGVSGQNPIASISGAVTASGNILGSGGSTLQVGASASFTYSGGTVQSTISVAAGGSVTFKASTLAAGGLQVSGDSSKVTVSSPGEKVNVGEFKGCDAGSWIIIQTASIATLQTEFQNNGMTAMTAFSFKQMTTIPAYACGIKVQDGQGNEVVLSPEGASSMDAAGMTNARFRTQATTTKGTYAYTSGSLTYKVGNGATAAQVSLAVLLGAALFAFVSARQQ